MGNIVFISSSRPFHRTWGGKEFCTLSASWSLSQTSQGSALVWGPLALAHTFCNSVFLPWTKTRFQHPEAGLPRKVNLSAPDSPPTHVSPALLCHMRKSHTAYFSSESQNVHMNNCRAGVHRPHVAFRCKTSTFKFFKFPPKQSLTCQPLL